MNKEQVINLWRNGHLIEAMETLRKEVPNVNKTFHSSLDNLQARYNRLKKDERGGTISTSDKNLEMNRISAAFVEICNEVWPKQAGSHEAGLMILDVTRPGRAVGFPGEDLKKPALTKAEVSRMVRHCKEMLRLNEFEAISLYGYLKVIYELTFNEAVQKRINSFTDPFVDQKNHLRETAEWLISVEEALHEFVEIENEPSIKFLWQELFLKPTSMNLEALETALSKALTNKQKREYVKLQGLLAPKSSLTYNIVLKAWAQYDLGEWLRKQGLVD